MKRLVRRLAWVGVAVTVVALGFGVTVRLLGPEPPGVTEANVRRIKLGMRLQQVEEILGGPAPVPPELHAGSGFYTWEGSGGQARVVFRFRVFFYGDATIVEETVDSASFERRKELNLLDRLRSLVGR